MTTHASESIFRWTREGTSPFWPAPLRTEEDLQALFNNPAFKSKLARGLQLAEPGWNGDEAVREIDAAVKTGNYRRITIAPNSPEAFFDWMLYGVANQNTGPTVWAGDHYLNGYLIQFEYKGHQEIMLANACVNVLKKSRAKAPPEVPPGEYVPREYPRYEPQPQQQVIVVQPQPYYLSPCWGWYPGWYTGWCGPSFSFYWGWDGYRHHHVYHHYPGPTVHTRPPVRIGPPGVRTW
jgi:hypothetical protein